MSVNRSEAALKSGLTHIAHILRDTSAIWVGYSGGLDSTVLLHLLKSGGYNVKALHVNHQMSINANFWEAHCRRFAKHLGVAFFAERVEVISLGAGPEAAAREQRYQVFNNYVGAGELLVLAHHADDQLETLLYRIMRGSGLKGLRGIVQKRLLKVGKPESGQVLRPLLQVTRKQILEYAKYHSLEWVTDESNAKLEFDRNYIRNQISPALKRRWPEAALHAANTARLVESSQALLNAYAREDLSNCALREERLGESILLSPFTAYSVERQRHILRCWLEGGGFSLPSEAQLAQLDHLIASREDAQPEVAWGVCVFHRFQGRLYLHHRIPEPQQTALICAGESEIQLPLGRLTIDNSGERGLKPGHYKIQFRQVGERCKPEGRGHSQTLKKLFQEYQLEPWLRDYIPILYANGEIAAVGDLFICEGYVCETGWKQRWKID